MSRLYKFLNQDRGTDLIPEHLYYGFIDIEEDQYAYKLVDFAYDLKFNNYPLNQLLGIEPNV